MSARTAGAFLVAAGASFWLAWSLMPGVGITDAQRILDLVGQHRTRVALSVILQLLSAACYAPALIGLVAQPAFAADRAVLWAAIALLVGAMGSAADAVFHLVAHAMTAPGLDPTGFATLMQIVQGPGLHYVLPMIAAFFLGSLSLSVVLARRGVVSPWNPALLALAFATGAIGGFAGPRAGIDARTVGLAVLAGVAGAQGWLGIAVGRIDATPR